MFGGQARHGSDTTRQRVVVARAAFTLIEVVVVIAVLALLVSMSMYAMGRVTNHTRQSATRVTLSNLRSMLKEYEVTTPAALTRQPPHMLLRDGRVLELAANQNPGIWQDADPSETTNAPEPDGALAPTNVFMNANFNLATDEVKFERYTAVQIVNTQIVMSMLLQSPRNRSMFAKIPTSQLMEKIPAGVTTQLTLSPGRAPLPALPLDAWGNPIIFVPAGGLCGSGNGDVSAMWRGGKQGDEGVVEIGNFAFTTGIATGPLRSPDHRPFWASAGPDGNFCTADDNLYSFEE